MKCYNGEESLIRSFPCAGAARSNDAARATTEIPPSVRTGPKSGCVALAPPTREPTPAQHMPRNNRDEREARDAPPTDDAVRRPRSADQARVAARQADAAAQQAAAHERRRPRAQSPRRPSARHVPRRDARRRRRRRRPPARPAQDRGGAPARPDDGGGNRRLLAVRAARPPAGHAFAYDAATGTRRSACPRRSTGFPPRARTAPRTWSTPTRTSWRRPAATPCRRTWRPRRCASCSRPQAAARGRRCLRRCRRTASTTPARFAAPTRPWRRRWRRRGPRASRRRRRRRHRRRPRRRRGAVVLLAGLLHERDAAEGDKFRKVLVSELEATIHQATLGVARQVRALAERRILALDVNSTSVGFYPKLVVAEDGESLEATGYGYESAAGTVTKGVPKVAHFGAYATKFRAGVSAYDADAAAATSVLSLLASTRAVHGARAMELLKFALEGRDVRGTALPEPDLPEAFDRISLPAASRAPSRTRDVCVGARRPRQGPGRRDAARGRAARGGARRRAQGGRGGAAAGRRGDDGRARARLLRLCAAVRGGGRRGEARARRASQSGALGVVVVVVNKRCHTRRCFATGEGERTGGMQNCARTPRACFGT